MKIAILVTYWKNTQGTGVTRYILNLVNEFKKYSDMDICILYRDGNDSENIRVKGTKYTFLFKAIPILYKFQPDIIYVDANWYFLLTGAFYKKFRRIKLIATMHSHPDMLTSLGKKIMNQLLNSCDVVTYVSENLKKMIHHDWGISINTREEITYAGVQLQAVTDTEVKEFIEKYNIIENSLVLLMQSSPIAIVKSDGTKILMESVQEMLPNHPEILLIITGNGPYLEELKGYASSLGICDRVVFTGWIDNPCVPLALCDIYTHISLGEGLPLALLEAMSIGKPIIATPVGGIPEVIDDMRNGLLVEPNPDKIAQAIWTLQNDEKKRAELGKNAYMDSKKYTWKKCADKFREIFKEGYN